ncbi:MAG: hypothetical protein ACI4VX_07735 [Succinivibrionaceae bacterium]
MNSNVAALSATPEMLKNDLNTFCYLFESLCIHDLRVYTVHWDSTFYHYIDEQENEGDAVIELPDGRWGLFEIQVGFNQVDKATRNQLRLQQIFKKESRSLPDFLCVICSKANTAFQRPDGVYVIPITVPGI